MALLMLIGLVVLTIVARVRRRGDRPLLGIYLANIERQGILVFY
jgi:hypothetical protein